MYTFNNIKRIYRCNLIYIHAISKTLRTGCREITRGKKMIIFTSQKNRKQIVSLIVDFFLEELTVADPLLCVSFSSTSFHLIPIKQIDDSISDLIDYALQHIWK